MRSEWSRRSLLHGAGVGLGAAALRGAVPACLAMQAPEPADRAAFRFVHLTDIHVQPELDAERGFRKCIAHVNALRPRPDFVVTGGDLIMDALEVDHARAVRLWKMFDDCCRDFEMPVHHTIGNHDIVGWSSKSRVGVDHVDYGKRMFADHAGQGRTYRSFDVGRWHFVLLDSIGRQVGSPEYRGWLDEEQIAWLLDDLDRVGTKRPIVLVTHIPFYTAYLTMAQGPLASPGEKSMIVNAFTLRKKLLKYDVRLVLQGHVHVRERIDYGRISYIQSGAVSGQWWKGPTLGEHPEGYGVIDVAGDDFAYHYEAYGWQAVRGG